MVALPARIPDDIGGQDALDAATGQLCSASFPHFVQRAWHTVHSEDEPLRWNWALGAVCGHMQAQAEGRIRNLLISIPPGFGKSLLVSVFYVAWRWTREPRYQHLAVSGLEDLATRDAGRLKTVVDSEWYQRTFRPAWKWDSGQDAKWYYQNTLGGIRWSRTVGQKITGLRPGTPGGITLDDPLDASEAFSGRSGCERVNRWYRYSLSTRRAVGNTTPLTIIMQRLAVMDLIGTLTSTPEEAARWCYLCIPQQWDGRAKEKTWIGWTDPRTTEGEFIDERLFGPEQAADAKVDLTTVGYATQHQQLPAPLEGALYRKTMIRHWTSLPCPHPYGPRGIAPPTTDAKWSHLSIHVDATYKDTKNSDRAAAGLWGLHGGIPYFLDLVAKKMTPSVLILEIKGMIRRWEAAGAKLEKVVIESKATGPTVLAYLVKELIRCEGYDPKGSKIERVMASLAPWEANEAVDAEGHPGPAHLLIPPVEACPWVRDSYLPELLNFPGARHDDVVDQGSQAVLWFRSKNLVGIYARAIR